MNVRALTTYERCSDRELASAIAGREPGAVRLLTQRHNRRLFRVAWSILQDRAEAEDTVQETYLRAIHAIADFDGSSSLSTWLTRIAINEALMRKRALARRQRAFDGGSVIVLDEYREKLMGPPERRSSPEAQLMKKELTRLLEDAVARLPDHLRIVFVLREIEGLSVVDAASALALKAATVKTRHTRARKVLRAALDPELKSALADAFPYAGADCKNLTERVLARLSRERAEATQPV